MNSNSKFYYNNDCEPCRKNIKDKRHQCPIIVKCGTPGATTIPAATIVGSSFTPASLSIDTSSICNPSTKLEYTSNIIATAFTGSISFQVFKQCKNQFNPIPVGPSFTYSRLVAITESTTFSFFICDNDSCNDSCCNYRVVATVNAVTAGILTINNATLGATSTCQLNNCN